MHTTIPGSRTDIFPVNLTCKVVKLCSTLGSEVTSIAACSIEQYVFLFFYIHDMLSDPKVSLNVLISSPTPLSKRGEDILVRFENGLSVYSTNSSCAFAYTIYIMSVNVYKVRKRIQKTL